MKHRYSAIAAAICLGLAPAAFAQQSDTATKGQNQATQAQPSMGASSTSSASMNSDTIKQVQQKLTEKGHNSGPADGVMGPQTQSALKDFQKAQGIEASGELDERTLTALGVDASGGGSMSSGSPPGAAATPPASRTMSETASPGAGSSTSGTADSGSASSDRSAPSGAAATPPAAREKSETASPSTSSGTTGPATTPRSGTGGTK